MTTLLSSIPASHYWPAYRWPAFSRLASQPSGAPLVVLPLAGLETRNDELPLDAEALLLEALLTDYAKRPATPDFLALPPLTYLPRLGSGSLWASDYPTAHRLVDEVCLSVKAAGFRRIAMVNCCPERAPFVDVAARDLRVNHQLQMFCLNLDLFGCSLPAKGELSATAVELLGHVLATLDGRPSATAATWGCAVEDFANLMAAVHAHPALKSA